MVISFSVNKLLDGPVLTTKCVPLTAREGIPK